MKQEDFEEIIKPLFLLEKSHREFMLKSLRENFKNWKSKNNLSDTFNQMNDLIKLNEINGFKVVRDESDSEKVEIYEMQSYLETGKYVGRFLNK